MTLAVIPARGGSKRIPRKNIRPFAGRPIIAWTIDAARASGCFERIVVSTDDEEIAAVARAHGAEAPFLRPAALADDHAGTIPVIRHAIETLGGAAAHPEICCLYATAPFLTGALVARAKETLDASGAAYAVTVTTYPFPIQRALRRTAGGRVEMFWPEHFTTRSQDLEEAYHDAGQCYWGRGDAWVEGRALFGPDTAPVVVPRHLVQDIDTGEDWTRAEWLFRARHAGGGER